MPIHGEYGKVDFITCTVDPRMAIVDSGELLPRDTTRLIVKGPDSAFMDGAVPDNCPRGARFDIDSELGCLVCPLALTEYEDGTIEC